jgi:hypothetical protein
MLQRGWKFTSLTRTNVPADPYFSSNAEVAPGHFIDHGNGMDCVNTGGAEVCDPPQGHRALFRSGPRPALHAHRRDVGMFEYVRRGRRLRVRFALSPSSPGVPRSDRPDH